MTVVCGTDFSEGARAALEVGAALAHRFGDGLVLATAVPPSGEAVLDPAWDRPQALEARVARWALDSAAGAVRDVRVEERVLVTSPAEGLAELAHRLDARMVVVGSHGRGALGRLVLGSVADRLVALSERPVLVVRHGGEGLVAWAREGRPLRMLACLDPDDAGAETLAAVGAFRRQAACDVVFAHVFPAPDAYEQLGLDDAVGDGPSLRRTLEAQVDAVPGQGGVELRVEPGWSRPAAVLERMVEEVGPDLVVVGSHARRGMARLWHGSVARALVHHVAPSVLCAHGWRAPKPSERAARPTPAAPMT